MGDVIAFRGKRRAPPSEITYGTSYFWSQPHIPMPPLLAYGRDAGSIGDAPVTATWRTIGGAGPLTPFDRIARADLIQFAKSGAPPARPLE
jgi:hypothetical protein